MNKHNLEFQGYEINLIRQSLELLKDKEYREHCKWELQSFGFYYYTDNKKVKQINFVLNSINRQLNGET